MITLEEYYEQRWREHGHDWHEEVRRIAGERKLFAKLCHKFLVRKINLPARTDYPKWKVIPGSLTWYLQLTPMPKVTVDLRSRK